MAGIYLHIPFCNSKCIYCGFYSVVSKDLRNKFIPALKKEILGRRNFFSSLYPSDRLIKTLYIGGGTPSVLDISVLKEAISLLRDEFSFPAAAFQTDNPDEFEFTVEVNPDDITPDYAHSLRQLGVNRVSMGVQSFQDTHLKWMCRRHTSLQAVEAFNTLRCAGFRNISLDLIFGFPLMTEIDWADNLDKVVSLGPEHISAYQLGIDPGTPLERLAEKGRFSLPGDETCEKMYKTLQSRLAEAGYFQYEVSNFCLKAPSSDNQEHFKDYRSRHNSSYWKRIPYLGLGPGAHSFIGRHREWNFSNVASYCSPDIVEIREGESLSPEDIFNEILMLGLRTADGAALEDLRQSSPQSSLFISDLLPKVHHLQQSGLISIDKAGAIKIPPEHFFISDGIIRDLFV